MTYKQLEQFAKDEGYTSAGFYNSPKRNSGIHIYEKKRENDDNYMVTEFILIASNSPLIGDVKGERVVRDEWSLVVIPCGVFKPLCSQLFNNIIQ